MTARASLITDQRMSGLPILVKYKHLKTICEQTLHNSPTVSSSSFLKFWRLCTIAQLSYLPVHAIFSLTFSRDLPCYRAKLLFSREISPNFSVAAAEIRDSDIFSVFLNDILVRFCIHVEYTLTTRGQEMMSVLQDQPVLSTSFTWEPYSASFQPF